MSTRTHNRFGTADVQALEARWLFAAVDVTIDGAAKFQTIDGFGAMLPTYSAARASLLYEDMGASVVRFQLNHRALRAPGDNSYSTPVTPVTLGPDLNENIAKFNFAAPQVAPVLNMVKASKTLANGPVKVLASIWTPPHWMKGPELNPWTGAYVDTDPNTEGTQFLPPRLSPGGSDTSGGSLVDSPESLTQFARYVAAQVKGTELATGVPIHAVSLQNEPRFHEPYDSAVYPAPLYVKALKAIAAEFRANGITTKLIGPEDVGVGPTSNPWFLEQQYMYINAVRADPQAFADVGGWGIHGFADDAATPGRSPTMWGQYYNGRPGSTSITGIKNDNKLNWMTESSGEPNDWAGAMRLAMSQQDALIQGNVNAWVYWDLEGPQTSFHSGALTANADPTAPKYVAAKHFAKFVRPGSVRVAATPSDPLGLYVSAYVDDAAKTLTGVLVNGSAEPQTVTLKLNNVSVGTFATTRRSAAGALWADGGPITVSNGVATITLAPQTILSLQGSTAPAQPTVEKAAGKVIGTAGSYGGYGNTIAKVFDGNLTTFFDAPQPTGAWAGLDLGAARAIKTVKFAPRPNLASRMVGGKFQGSDTADFSANVVDLHTVTVAPPVGALTEVNVAGVAGTFRYVRYLAPANAYGNVAEVEFWAAADGTVPPPPPPDPQPPESLTGTPIGTPGSYGTSGNTFHKALDKDLATFFDAATPSGNWVGLDLGTAKTITSLRYAPRPNLANRMVGGRFEASNAADFSSGVATLFTVTAAPVVGELTTQTVTVPGAYRYVRYVSPSGSYGNVAEVQFVGTAPAAGTPTQFAGTVIGTAGAYNNGTNTREKAVDGSVSTFFDGPTPTGNWVGLDLGSAKAVKQVKYAPRSGLAGRMVGGKFQASDTADFSANVVDLYTITAAPVVGALTSADIVGAAAYRYVRYLSPANSYGNVAEVEFWG